jgi:hypothetical protein
MPPDALNKSVSDFTAQVQAVERPVGVQKRKWEHSVRRLELRGTPEQQLSFAVSLRPFLSGSSSNSDGVT